MSLVINLKDFGLKIFFADFHEVCLPNIRFLNSVLRATQFIAPGLLRLCFLSVSFGLKFKQVGIQAVLIDEFFMSAQFSFFTIFEEKYSIGHSNRAESVTY